MDQCKSDHGLELAIGTDITAEDLSNLKLYAQYAGAAYCDPIAGKPVHCKGDICPTLGSSNITIHSVFQYVSSPRHESLQN